MAHERRLALIGASVCQPVRQRPPLEEPDSDKNRGFVNANFGKEEEEESGRNIPLDRSRCIGTHGCHVYFIFDVLTSKSRTVNIALKGEIKFPAPPFPLHVNETWVD